jgi:hypothetical protein
MMPAKARADIRIRLALITITRTLAALSTITSTRTETSTITSTRTETSTITSTRAALITITLSVPATCAITPNMITLIRNPPTRTSARATPNRSRAQPVTDACST